MYTYGFVGADGCLSMSRHYLQLSGFSPVPVRSRLALATLSRRMAHTLYVFLAEGHKDK